MARKTNQLEEGNPKKTVPGGVLYCCVPLCHSYKGKIVDGKVQLHRLPKDTKAKRLWIAKLRNVRKKPGTRVCSLHFEGRNGPKPWCQFPTLFPSKPKLESHVQKRPLPDRTRGEAALHSTVIRGINSEVNSEDSLEIKKNRSRANNFSHCFHDCIRTEPCKVDSEDLFRDGSRDTGV